MRYGDGSACLKNLSKKLEAWCHVKPNNTDEMKSKITVLKSYAGKFPIQKLTFNVLLVVDALNIVI